MARYDYLTTYSASLNFVWGSVDYTDFDAVNEVFLNNSDSTVTGDAVPQGSYSVNSRGVQLIGTPNSNIRQEITPNGNEKGPRMVVAFFKPLEIKECKILDGGDSTVSTTETGVQLNTNGTLSVIIGNVIRYTTLNPIVIGELTVIGLHVPSNSGDPFIVYGDKNNPYTEAFTGPLSTVKDQLTWSFMGDRRNTISLSSELYYTAAGINFSYTQGEIIDYCPIFNVVGTITMQTNLEAIRLQGVSAVAADRSVDSSSGVPAGETDLTISLFVDFGDLVEFVAFDSDESSTFLTTGLVLPDELEPLVFNPVSGGGGGDPGTGLLAHIAGTVSIDGTGSEREVIVISDDPTGRKVLGEGVSASNGAFDIEYADWGGAVIALALDVYGGDWNAETVLASGTIIHPTAPNGYVYEVTNGGTTGTTEPTWSTTNPVNDGSVTYSPKAFYRPIASGPLQGEILQEGTPTGPTPYRYFRIIITANNGDSYTGLNEIELRATQNGADLTTPATVVTTTSEFSGSTNYVIEHLVDDDTTTAWFNESGVLPLTIEVDLGSEQAVAWLSMLRSNLSDPSLLNQCPKDFSVEASTNGTDWVSLAAFGSVTDWAEDEPYLFVLQAE